jgi:hypothetical protein
MIKKEKDILKEVINHPDGLLAPVDYINCVCKRDKNTAHKLVSQGYIEEVPTTLPTGHYNFYRATEKGHSIFYPIPKKIWYFIKGDVRTIIVAIIVSIITTIITLLVEKSIK